MDDKQRSRGWCFTLNNYSEEEYEKVKNTLHSNTPENWIIGKEIGTSGTKHLQGYVYWKNTKTFNVMKNMIPRAHLEKAKGNKKHNYEYCSKEGKFECSGEFGDIKKEKYGGYSCMAEWVRNTLFISEYEQNINDWTDNYNINEDYHTEEEIENSDDESA